MSCFQYKSTIFSQFFIYNTKREFWYVQHDSAFVDIPQCDVTETFLLRCTFRLLCLQSPSWFLMTYSIFITWTGVECGQSV